MAKGYKTGGRKKGVPNKVTSETREILKDIVTKELEALPSYLEGVKPKVKIDILIKLLPYILPRINPVPMDSGEPNSWDFSF